jgi:hypothetical protein
MSTAMKILRVLRALAAVVLFVSLLKSTILTVRWMMQ